MKRALKFLVLIAFASTGLASAGDRVGNGGDAVVCYTDKSRTKITSVELFDYWEMNRVLKIPRGVDLGPANLTVKKKIDVLLGRLENLDAARAHSVRQVAHSLADNIDRYLVTGADIPEIDDANPRLIPHSPCYIEQYAVQWKDPVSGQRRFAISARIYRDAKANNTARAGIILHEAIYRMAILQGSENSDGTRLFNYLLATHALDGADVDAYGRALTDAKLADPRCRPLDIQDSGTKKFRGFAYLHRSSFWDTYFLCAPMDFEYDQLKIRAASGSRVDLDQRTAFPWSIALAARSRVSALQAGNWVEETMEPHEGGELSSAHFSLFKEGGVWNLTGLKKLTFAIRPSASQSLVCLQGTSFREDGVPTGCYVLQEGQRFSFQGQDLHLGNVVEFDAQLRLTRTKIDNVIRVRLHGSSRMVETTDHVYFDPSGALLHGFLVQPIVMDVNGFPTQVSWASIDPSTGLSDVEVIHQLDPIFQGKPVISLSGSPVGGSLCGRFGYNKYYDYFDHSKLARRYVSAEETFYDPVRNQRVTKVDEEVLVLQGKVGCRGVFKVRL